ncbi:hypothetical protein TIFTF001_019630 [Ficus carica]|uniref:Uncharacterized protein n=1 Tax=Ficus carica TaxID=3494 RepID=A0AA88DBY3_FICCA|nr:hypothetical protein TIFTF001_019630 [Ficus carica]
MEAGRGGKGAGGVCRQGAGEPGGSRPPPRAARGPRGGWPGVSRRRRGGHRSGSPAMGKSPVTEKTWGEKVYMR